MFVCEGRDIKSVKKIGCDTLIQRNHSKSFSLNKFHFRRNFEANLRQTPFVSFTDVGLRSQILSLTFKLKCPNCPELKSLRVFFAMCTTDDSQNTQYFFDWFTSRTKIKNIMINEIRHLNF